MTGPPLRLAPAVAAALAAGEPVVALESVVISHGLPQPVNQETALACEDEVRAAGAQPATIAVLGGTARVGLAPGTIAQLATGALDPVAKLSRRDLGRALALGLTGATTVAGTMIVAARAGIRVLATGGIGGVHPGLAERPDISADLGELARTPVVVVCSGAKSIVDLAATLELLETLGVPVIGYGCDEFPAFYTPHSGLPVPMRADSPEAVAAIAAAHWALGLESGLLVAVPVPPAAALDREREAAAIAEAQAAAAAAGVTGAALTPYLLARIAATTERESLRANVALLRHNARVAGAIACALAAMQR